MKLSRRLKRGTVWIRQLPRCVILGTSLELWQTHFPPFAHQHIPPQYLHAAHFLSKPIKAAVQYSKQIRLEANSRSRRPGEAPGTQQREYIERHRVVGLLVSR